MNTTLELPLRVEALELGQILAQIDGGEGAVVLFDPFVGAGLSAGYAFVRVYG